MLHIYRAYGQFSIPTARRFSSNLSQLAPSRFQRRKEIQKRSINTLTVVVYTWCIHATLLRRLQQAEMNGDNQRK